jgi:hypothetical protein
MALIVNLLVWGAGTASWLPYAGVIRIKCEEYDLSLSTREAPLA